MIDISAINLPQAKSNPMRSKIELLGTLLHGVSTFPESWLNAESRIAAQRAHPNPSSELKMSAPHTPLTEYSQSEMLAPVHPNLLARPTPVTEKPDPMQGPAPGLVMGSSAEETFHEDSEKQKKVGTGLGVCGDERMPSDPAGKLEAEMGWEKKAGGWLKDEMKEHGSAQGQAEGMGGYNEEMPGTVGRSVSRSFGFTRLTYWPGLIETAIDSSRHSDRKPWDVQGGRKVTILRWLKSCLRAEDPGIELSRQRAKEVS